MSNKTLHIHTSKSKKLESIFAVKHLAFYMYHKIHNWETKYTML